MEYKSLNKKIILGWRIKRGITLLILIILYAVLAYFLLVQGLDMISPPLKKIIMLLFGVVVFYKIVGLVVFPILEYRQWKYNITDDKVEIIHGIFFVNKTVIPIIRIQNITVSQGPINRLFDLYKVKIFLASGSFYIEGLSCDESQSLCENLKTRIYTRIAEKGVL